MAERSTIFPINLGNTDNPWYARLLEIFEGEGRYFEISGLRIDGEAVEHKLLAKAIAESIDPFVGTYSFEEFESMKRRHMVRQINRYNQWSLGIGRGENNQQGTEMNSLYDEHQLWNFVLNCTGILVDKEMERYTDHLDHIKYCQSGSALRNNIRDILADLDAPSLSADQPSKKILKMNHAQTAISTLRHSGYRIGIAFGSWDLNHPGHGHFLETSKNLMGKYGKLFVAVSNDREIKLRKGSHRPINTLEQRVKQLSRLSIVDGVIPTPIPDETDSSDDLGHFYTDTMKKLGPHFRLIGMVEEDFEVYSQECAAAGISFLYTSEDRITSTTETINQILDRYRDE